MCAHRWRERLPLIKSQTAPAGTATSATLQQEYALVIGINGPAPFGGEGTVLRYADRDAGDFAAFIETEHGGAFPLSHVHLLTNLDATRDNVYKEFDWLRRTAGPYDVVYVFFAGHGVEYHSELYFVPINATEDNLTSQGIPMAEFRKKVTTDLIAKQAVVFIDSCHAAQAEQGARGGPSADLPKEWAQINDKEGQVSMVLFSSLEYQKSWEDPELGGGHGLFTWYLLEALKGAAPSTPQGWITADSVLDYVKQKVEARSQAKFPTLQTPINSPGFRTDYVLAYSTPLPPSKPPVVPPPCGGTANQGQNTKDCLNYVWVPAGGYPMGCVPSDEKSCYSDERPRHKVSISKGFFISETEVTVNAYRRFVGNTAMPPPPHFNATWASGQEPIVNVNWQQAGDYCSRLGGRLPTEAEWEYAARAGDEYSKYPWGSDVITRDNANYGREDHKGPVPIGKDRWKYATPVRQFPANKWGLFDMAGNVWEWTADCYEADFYVKSPANDPHNDPAGRACNMVVRGGSWEDDSFFLRSSMRNNFSPAKGYPDVGFRCVLPSLNKQEVTSKK